jgi:ribonuclease BN (tRNA processing enzyme)
VEATPGLELQVLGAGPAYSDDPDSRGAAYLVRGAGTAMLLDLGHGAFSALAAAIEPSALAGVAISHLHPDHFIDLIPLRHYLCRAEHQPARRLRVIAPPGLDRRLDGVYDQPGFTASAFELEPPPSGRIDVGALRIEARPVRHAAGSHAYRVDLDGTGGPGIVYSGDCGQTEDLRPLIQEGDLLLCEATFGPGPVMEGVPHVDGPAVGRLARETGVGRVVVTHIRMGCDLAETLASVRAIYDGPVELARPGSQHAV